MITGTIFNIQRFCTDDGPGIRTTVFLKGCPLHCIWCHNPESQVQRNEVMFDEKKCMNCGKCGTICPRKCHLIEKKHAFKRSLCVGCGACVARCPSKALELYGKTITVDECYEEVKKDKVFYENSGGGVTISGGEPLFQPEFTAGLLRVCQEDGIHTAIETSGFADERVLLSVIKYCNLILFDIKETDAAHHQRYTGAPLSPILENLNIINEKKIPFIIRAPIIPTLNDRDAHFKALKAMHENMQYCQGIQIMPYHRVGTYKYDLLNKKNLCSEVSEPSKEMIEAWNKLI